MRRLEARLEPAHLVGVRGDGEHVDARLGGAADERARHGAHEADEVRAVAVGLALSVVVVTARQRGALAVHGDDAEGQSIGLEGLAAVRRPHEGVQGAAQLFGLEHAEQIAQGGVGDAMREAESSTRRDCHLSREGLGLREALAASDDRHDHRTQEGVELQARSEGPCGCADP